MKKPGKISIIPNTIQRKLFYIISALIIGTVILVSVFSHLRFAADYTRQSSENTRQLIDQIALNLDAYIDEVTRLCLSPYYSREVMEELMSTPRTDQEKLNKKRKIEDYLGQVMTTPRKDILRVYIFSDAVYSCNRTSHDADIRTYESEEWYQAALSGSQSVILPPQTESGSGAPITFFSVAKQICSLKDNSQVLGVIRVDANYSGIKSVCDRVSAGSGNALMILDKSGNLIYDHSTLKEPVSSEEVLQELAQDGHSSIKLHGTSYLFHAQSIPSTGWNVIAIHSKDEIYENAGKTLVFNLLIAFFMVILGVVLSGFTLHRNLRPLYQTVSLMQQAQNGDLSVRADTKCTAEISYLNASFNRMLEQIQQMILQEAQLTKQVYEAKYLQKQAQFDSLYHQIQPHFLFNTLNTTSLLIKCQRYPEAVTSIEQLSVLLRGIINSEKEISLEAELAITGSYLQLQKLRNSYLHFSIETNGTDLSLEIPALSIQPLVENALIHGCGSLERDFLIEVSISSGEELLSIRVCDNGAGMTEEELAVLKQRVNNSGIADDRLSSNGIGLVNIQKRIHLKYGEAYGLEIQSRKNKGTIITLSVPKGVTPCTQL